MYHEKQNVVHVVADKETCIKNKKMTDSSTNFTDYLAARRRKRRKIVRRRNDSGGTKVPDPLNAPMLEIVAKFVGSAVFFVFFEIF